MRFLFLLPSFTESLGGIQTYNQSLIQGLLEVGQGKGWELEVLALNDRPGTKEPAYLSHPALKVHCFARNKWAFAAAALRKAGDQDSIFLGHIHFSSLAWLLRLVAPKATLRQLVYGVEVWRPLSWVTRLGLGRLDAIWSISDFTRLRMIEFNPGIRHLGCGILPCTLGPSSGAQAELVASLPNQGRTLLCVSRMAASEPYKNVEALIRAMPDVLKEVPGTRLIIVGPGDDRPRLEVIAASLGLGDRVHFAGQVSDAVLQSYFAACDLFVLPSTREGFGIVYLEAMQHAKACIGARAGAAPEVIEDGVTGLLVDPEDPAQLPAAIIRLLHDNALRKRMGEAGRNRLEEKFSMTAFRQRLEELLR